MKAKKLLKIKEVSLFYFNPNTLDDQGWLALGLPEGKLKVLRNYQKSGGYFKQKEDLKRCFAIGDDFYNTIKEYVSIPKNKKPSQRMAMNVVVIILIVYIYSGLQSVC